MAGDAAQFYAFRLPHPYAISGYELDRGGFYYSPVAAMFLYPLTLAGPYVMSAAMTALAFASLYALVGHWALLAMLFPPVWWEVSLGNMNLLLGVAAVWGLRYPALWTIPLLTKVTPGIGVLWFVVRREWRSAGIALCVTVLLVFGSYLVLPHLWGQWILSLTGSVGSTTMAGAWTLPIPLVVRLPIAALVVVWAARTDRPWALLVACTLAIPVLWWPALAPLVAVPRLLANHVGVEPRLGSAAFRRAVGLQHGSYGDLDAVRAGVQASDVVDRTRARREVHPW